MIGVEAPALRRRRAWSIGLAAALAMALACVMANGSAATTKADAVEALLEKYASLEEALRQNKFKQPLVLESADSRGRLTGDIYAIVAYPLSTVSAGVSNADHWCDVLILHINTKYCHAVVGSSGTTLRVNIGKKTPEELGDALRIVFNYSVAAATPGYVEVSLDARDGPLGTRDYRILLEAIALPGNKTFLHLAYSYAIDLFGRLAMNAYFGTAGSDRVGFTVIGTRADGEPDFVAGMRGMLERNTMRYYLAIDSYLAAVAVTPAAQPEYRLQNWFTAVERYPRQLHEMDRNEYLEMKRSELQRQQTVQ